MDNAQLCEVCSEREASFEMDLNTDEESEPLFWHVCIECALQLI